MAEARAPDVHYGSRGLPAAYRHPGCLGPHEPSPSGPRVTINDTIRESVVEPREEGRHSGRRECTPTPRAMGVVEVSVSAASLLGMLETLYVSKTFGV